MKTSTLNFIIENAVEREQDSYELYTKLAEKMPDAEQKATLQSLAKSELEHKKLLEDIDIEMVPAEQKESIEVHEAMPQFDTKIILQQTSTVPEILDFAIQKEHESFMHYKDLANSLPNGKLKELFTFLANQETGHESLLVDLKKNL